MKHDLSRILSLNDVRCNGKLKLAKFSYYEASMSYF